MTTPTTQPEAQWREEAKKVWDEQGRAHWVNLSDFDNYTAGYIRARTEQAYELLAEGKIFEAKELLEKRVNNPVFIGK